MCVSGGPGPKNPGKQYLYVSNSWQDSAPAAGAEFTGEVYKMELDGTIVGKFGRAGKAPGEFATIHQMDCRDPERDLHRRDQQLALAEDPAQAAGDEDQRARVRSNRHVTHTHCCRGCGDPRASADRSSRSPVFRRSRSTIADLLKTPNDVVRRRSRPASARIRRARSSSTRAPGIPTRRSATTARSRAAARGCSCSIANGKFVREWGQDVYGFNAAIGLRVDPQDNVWTIDAAANQVVKFDPDGSVGAGARPQARNDLRAPGLPAAGRVRRRRLRRRAGAPAVRRRWRAGRRRRRRRWRRRRPRAGLRHSRLELQPSDRRGVGQGRQHLHRRRHRQQQPRRQVRQGRPVHHALGLDRHGPGPVHRREGDRGLDAPGDVYVADAGNKRIQVFDGDGKFKSEFGNVGTPLAMCMTRGATQYLYISHAGDEDGMEDAAIYKVHARRQGGRQVRQRPASC